jgi:hypothetical protein
MRQPESDAPAAPRNPGETNLRDGIDLTLIDEMLRLSPEERIRFHDGVLNSILELRRAVEEADESKD